MTRVPCHRPSDLFTLRVWREALGDGQVEWRGQLRHVASGQTRYFRDWQTLITLLQARLAEEEPPADSP